MVSTFSTFDLSTFLGSLAVSFFCLLSILLSVNLFGMTRSSVSNTVHDVSFHIVHIEVSLPLHGSNSDILSQCVRTSRTCDNFLEMHQDPSVSVQ